MQIMFIEYSVNILLILQNFKDKQYLIIYNYQCFVSLIIEEVENNDFLYKLKTNSIFTIK